MNIEHYFKTEEQARAFALGLANTNKGDAFQAVTCDNPDCEASWVDCYELSGYDKLER